MRADLAPRLLQHLTLALAGTCLTYAERDFLPELQLLLPPFLLLVGAACWVEGRWALTAWSANALGVLIALGTGLLFARRSQELGSWLPYVGPVLMALTLVKLYRPRTPGDFWLLHGLGLLQVGLGGVLTTGFVFGALLVHYVACALCSLAAHSRQAEQHAAQRAGPPAPPRWARFALRWVLAVGGLAVPAFLATPRGEAPPWGPLERLAGQPAKHGPAQTGFGDEIDINRTGVVEVNAGMAFTVQALDAHGQPRLDLPGDQRWRGAVLDAYQDGHWTSLLHPTSMPIFRAPREPVVVPPGGSDLHFTVQLERAGGLFLADPVRLGPVRGALPVLVLGKRQQRELPLFGESAGTVLPRFYLVPGEYRYRQIRGPDAARDRYPALRVPDEYKERLLAYPRREPGLARLAPWTADLLRRLSGEPRHRRFGLRLPPPDDNAFFRPWLTDEQFLPAAQLLCEHLAHSGEYTYSLEQRRHDPTLDPALDFLQNVKQGHCERYAAALALMLRSVGIPARLVKGFRGLEAQRDGNYLVRQSHAHSWVEALIPRLDEPGAFEWVVLDPTPDADAPPAGTFSLTRWWEERRRNGQDVWQGLIVGYNANQQADLWEGLPSGRLLLRLEALALGALALALLTWAGLGLRRRRRGRSALPTSVPAFYARLLKLLARRARLRPTVGQTPRELAAAAETALALGAAAALANVPGRIVELLYRVRFGGQALDEAEAREVETRLDEMAAALKGTAPPARAKATILPHRAP